MHSKSYYKLLKEENINSCDKKKLVDIKAITVEKSKSARQKTESFIHQVKNPYLFKVGDIIVKVEFNENIDFTNALAKALCGK